MELFIEVCRRGGLKVNASKSKVMVLGREEGVDKMRLEDVSDSNTWDVFWMNRVQMRQCRRRGIAGTIAPSVNARGLHTECTRVLYESLLIPVLMYGSEAMIWKGNERSRSIQMNSFRFARYQESG